MAAHDVVKFSKSGTVVYVDTTQVDENYNNAINAIKIPSTGSTPETTQIINLNKMEDRFTITGHLTNGKYDSSDTYTTAKDKKDGLKTMIGGGSVVTMTYEGTDYSVAVDKYQITYRARDEPSTDDDDIVVYDVIISCVKGEDIV